MINNSAVSDVEGEGIPFYTPEESIGISSLKPFRPTHELTAQVKTVKLDNYLRENGVNRIDFLKIDTEGCDLMVLKGLDLVQHAVEVIVCEFEDKKTKPLGYLMQDLAEYLQSFGYTVYVSEWHPVIRYGGPHQWRVLKLYPCELEDPNACGKLLAFKSDPGIWALTNALSNNMTSVEQNKPLTCEPQTLEVELQVARNRIRMLEAQLSDVFGSISTPLRIAKSAAKRVLRTVPGAKTLKKIIRRYRE